MKWTKVLFVSALTLSLVACGNEEAEPTKDVQADTQIEEIAKAGISITDALGKAHTFEKAPASIATLSAGEMDILVALGANVTGRPTQTGDASAEIQAIDEIGNPHEPSFEAIAKVNPEVLIAPPSFMQFAKNIEQTGTKVIYMNADSVEEVQQSITSFGTLFEKETEAATINEKISTKIAEAKIQNPVDTLLVYGAPGTYLVALDNSLAGDILKTVGGKNIASDFPATEKYPSYATLSIEKIVERNPQVIMLLTHANPEAVKEGFMKQMNENAAWKNLDAVKNDRILILPAELFGNNPGTKIVDALDYMKATLNDLQ